MRVKLLIAASLVLVSCGMGLVGCKKSKASVAVSPHSAEGVLLKLEEQGRLLNDALVRKDYAYIHDYGYYFGGLTQAFFTKLDDSEKARLRGSLDELSTLASQLDRAAGGRHPEATEASVQRLQTLLKELDKQFREVKHSG